MTEQVAPVETTAAPAAETAPTETPAAPESGTVTTAAPETPAAPAETAKKKREAAKFAELARAERARRAKEAKLAEREAAIEARAKELESLKGRIGQFKEDPDGVMKAVFGVTFEEAVKQHLLKNAPEARQEEVLSKVQALEAELKARDEREAAAKKAWEERQQAAQYEQAVTAVKQEMVRIVQSAPTQFPHLAGYDDASLANAAFNKAKGIHKATGKPPTEEEVLRALESDAAAAYKNFEQRRQERLGALQAESDSRESQQGSGSQERQPKSRTLTNSTTATRATPKRELTEEEIDAMALAELKAAFRQPRR